MLKMEKSLWLNGIDNITGVDEVGRGCLAGPVVAAAVILPKGFNDSRVIDSKQLSHALRESAYEMIIKKSLSYAVSAVPVNTIDKINILNASMNAMWGAINKLEPKPEFILIDGNRAPVDLKVPFECIVKGDQKSRSIAAASIIAKVVRDRLMVKLSKLYPEYKFESNKGYGTAAHVKALSKFGPTPHHRYSFSPVRQMTFQFK